MRSPELNVVEVLVAARRVADFASERGAQSAFEYRRPTYTHIGAVLVDSILQAGLNYNSVVRPRVLRVINEFPETSNTSAIVNLISLRKTAYLLDWHHDVKLDRFERVVEFLVERSVEDVTGLRGKLIDPDFCLAMLHLHGVGPKTIDYMSCLSGIESIAVDRHIKSFASKAGVDQSDYYFLKRAFCFAADLLSISRRAFDAWVWQKESQERSPQLSLAL